MVSIIVQIKPPTKLGQYEVSLNGKKYIIKLYE